ncbi:amidase family protein [Haloarculaceae archaeon H-GB2-1]|nr:amidase family protein [Haloarculaceae archaeon H-GB2-1]
MTSDFLASRSLTTLAADIRDGTITAADAVDGSLDRIERLDDDLNAFITVTPDRAREAAREADRERRAGEQLGPLHGVPIAIKDSRPVEGFGTPGAASCSRTTSRTRRTPSSSD